MIGKIAALEFQGQLPTSKHNNVVDAIILGLNMLNEELQANVVEKSKLSHINEKLEKFALTTAHDLKSPINSITGLLTLLDYSLKSGNKTETAQYVTMLKSTTEKMKELVVNILNYSRHSPEDLNIELIDMASTIRQITSIDRTDRFAHIRLQEPLPTVQFNPPALIQVFRNIFSNAIKYSDKETCEITISSLEKDNHFEIRVADNGPGIEPENQQKIFELFNRIGPAVEADSHGVGLASIKSILASFREKIWAESFPGNGAIFCFTLSKQR